MLIFCRFTVCIIFKTFCVFFLLQVKITLVVLSTIFLYLWIFIFIQLYIWFGYQTVLIISLYWWVYWKRTRVWRTHGKVRYVCGVFTTTGSMPFVVEVLSQRVTPDMLKFLFIDIHYHSVFSLYVNMGLVNGIIFNTTRFAIATLR